MQRKKKWSKMRSWRDEGEKKKLFFQEKKKWVWWAQGLRMVRKEKIKVIFSLFIIHSMFLVVFNSDKKILVNEYWESFFRRLLPNFVTLSNTQKHTHNVHCCCAYDEKWNLSEIFDARDSPISNSSQSSHSRLMIRKFPSKENSRAD